MQTQNTDTRKFGVITKITKGAYSVSQNGEITVCRLSSKLTKQDVSYDRHFKGNRFHLNGLNQQSVELVAIGDHVTFVPVNDGEGVIVDRTARQNYLARRGAKPMPSAHASEQIIAANVDQVIPIFAAAEPEPKWHMLDRYLVAAESQQIPSSIVITKFDLVKGQPIESETLAVIERYQRVGYRVILTSAKDQLGLDDLQQIMATRTSVLVGKSGVGKTTLLNLLEPDLGLRIQAVNPTTGKGRHTTTTLEMFALSMGGAIIDTPGVREFGIWGLEPADIADCYPEMRPLLGLCKFGLSCQHDQEPGCAIRQAVMKNEISPYRYKSYLRLIADL